MHGGIRLEHGVQSRKPCVGVREMMENAGTDNLVEILVQFVYLLDGKLVDLKIF
jgi:hypothetical protein